MTILRTDISRALDELINNEAGTSFQALAVVLAKQKWPDLIASEWHNDGGLDAYAPASLAEGKKAKGVASSITGTLGKIKDDAKWAKENYQELEVLIFVTPRKITVSTAKKWAEKVHEEFSLTLYIISLEDIITSLTLPSNASLYGTLPGNPRSYRTRRCRAAGEGAQSYRGGGRDLARTTAPGESACRTA